MEEGDALRDSSIVSDDEGDAGSFVVFGSWQDFVEDSQSSLAHDLSEVRCSVNLQLQQQQQHVVTASSSAPSTRGQHHRVRERQTVAAYREHTSYTTSAKKTKRPPKVKSDIEAELLNIILPYQFEETFNTSHVGLRGNRSMLYHLRSDGIWNLLAGDSIWFTIYQPIDGIRLTRADDTTVEHWSPDSLDRCKLPEEGKKIRKERYQFWYLPKGGQWKRLGGEFKLYGWKQLLRLKEGAASSFQQIDSFYSQKGTPSLDSSIRWLVHWAVALPHCDPLDLTEESGRNARPELTVGPYSITARLGLGVAACVHVALLFIDCDRTLSAGPHALLTPEASEHTFELEVFLEDAQQGGLERVLMYERTSNGVAYLRMQWAYILRP